ncbi:hypothetical protein OHA77_29960 [Streptosporangium sp. NBC_01639]|uniref:WXG100-like domain-containing protein n=1 Tax=Streptosporangium sp. NBC_01639 TaxID=2975948 RepID=UPI0038682047|nr:hypothetical protein OHA77_29960 [Streptosporangium sp. NBC_01639]
MRLNRSALFPLGAAGMMAIVLNDIYQRWPEGDPDGARQAAAVWRSIGTLVATSQEDMESQAMRVWRDNPGEGSDAFRAFWSGGLFSPLPSGAQGPTARFSFPDYAEAVTAHCERTAEGCEEYAEGVEATQHALTVIAATEIAQLTFAGAWPLVGGPGTAAIKWAADKLRRQYQIEYLMMLFQRYVAKIVREKLANYAAGSAFFALADTTISIGTKAAFGDGPGSFQDNAAMTMKDFAACLVFFGVWDLTRVGPLGKALDNDAGNFASFYIGSNSYTVAYNAMDGKSGTDLLPTLKQLMAKAAVGTMQGAKTPG